MQQRQESTRTYQAPRTEPHHPVLEKGEKTEPTPVYREFDGLGEARRNILSLIAERLRAEKASAEYRDVEQQGPAIVSKIKVNLRA